MFNHKGTKAQRWKWEREMGAAVWKSGYWINHKGTKA